MVDRDSETDPCGDEEEEDEDDNNPTLYIKRERKEEIRSRIPAEIFVKKGKRGYYSVGGLEFVAAALIACLHISRAIAFRGLSLRSIWPSRRHCLILCLCRASNSSP